MRALSLIILAGAALLPCLRGQSAVLYGVNGAGGLFGTVDRNTGAWTTIGALGTGGPMLGLALDSTNNVMYGSEPGALTLWHISQTTGIASLIGPSGFFNVAAIEHDRTTGTLYGAASNTSQLFRFNVMTGAGTLVGSFGSGLSIVAMAHDPVADTLYGLEEFTARVMTINRTTGTATPLPFPIGVAGSYHGLAFDEELNLLWAVTANPPGLLVRIDPATGIGTLGTFTVPYIHALAFRGPGPGAGNYQVNQPGATLTINGVSGTGTTPATVNLALNQVGTVSLASVLSGNPFEVGVGSPPLLAANQGALVTSDGQIMNLRLVDPTLIFLFSGFQSPPFANLSLPISAPTPLAVAFQMAVLDAAAPSGVRLSQPVRLLVP